MNPNSTIEIIHSASGIKKLTNRLKNIKNTKENMFLKLLLKYIDLK